MEKEKEKEEDGEGGEGMRLDEENLFQRSTWLCRGSCFMNPPHREAETQGWSKIVGSSTDYGVAAMSRRCTGVSVWRSSWAGWLTCHNVCLVWVGVAHSQIWSVMIVIIISLKGCFPCYHYQTPISELASIVQKHYLYLSAPSWSSIRLFFVHLVLPFAFLSLHLPMPSSPLPRSVFTNVTQRKCTGR